MTSALRLLTGATALALAAYILALAYPDCLARSGAEFHNVAHTRSDLDHELAFGRQLEEERRTVLARTQTKHQMLLDLIAERRTLLDTAMHYRDLDRGMGRHQAERLGAIWPGSCQLERYCHQIIQVAEWELSDQPKKAAAVVVRLKRELLAAAESGAFCSLDNEETE
jgi:hypothetical protein